MKKKLEILFNYLQNNKWYLFFLLIICISQILVAGRANLNDYYPDHDINQYRNLALSSPQIDHTILKPFIYRLLAPYLIGLLFNNVDVGFYFVNFLFSILFVILLYYFFLKFEISKKISFFITVAFIFNRYFIPYLAFEPYRALDIITATILLLSLILLIEKKFIYIFIISAIGVLTKEAALLIIPVGLSYIYFTEPKNKKALFIFTGFSVILILILLSIRFLVPSNYGISLSTAFEENWSKIISVEAITKQLFIAFNPFFLLPVFQFKKYLLFNKKYPHFFVLLLFVLLSSLFGGDKERLMLPYAPVYYLFIALLFQNIDAIRKIKSLEIIVILIISLLSNMHHIWGVIHLPSREYSLIFALAGGILILGIYIRMNVGIMQK